MSAHRGLPSSKLFTDLDRVEKGDTFQIVVLNEVLTYQVDLIKVITGIRRCGKSTLLELFQEELKENGIADNQIISINFENPDYEKLQDRKRL